MSLPRLADRNARGFASGKAPGRTDLIVTENNAVRLRLSVAKLQLLGKDSFFYLRCNLIFDGCTAGFFNSLPHYLR